MRRERQIKGRFEEKIKRKGPLNNVGSVFLATDTKTEQQQYIVKAINLGQQFQALRKMQQATIKKLYGSSQPMVRKPQQYAFDQQTQCFLLVDRILSLNLESVIQLHKLRQDKGDRINPTIVYSFACKVYDMLNRIKNSGTEFYHRNLKPSNIFFNVVQGEIDWKITQFGLYTRYPNKYYQIIRDITNKSKTNISFMSQDYEADLYSLGVILLEMITLAPIDKIYKNLCGERSINSLQEVAEAKNYYGEEIITFIKELFRPRETIKQAFTNLKQNPPEFSEISSYKEVEWSYQKFEELIKTNPYLKLVDRFKKSVEEHGIKVEEVIRVAQKYDPDLDFQFLQYKQIQSFFAYFQVDLSEQQLIQVCFMMKCCSGMNYMEIVKMIFPPKNLLEDVVKKAIEKYSTRKQFFEAQTGGREFWKAEDVIKFLHSVGVYLNEKDVTEVVKQWSGENKRTSIKYDEFNRLFKGIGNEAPASMRSQNKTNKSQMNEKTLVDLLNQLRVKLKQDNKNLVHFFRLYDKDGRWVVGPQIEKQLQKRVSVADKLFRELCEEMWEVAGIVGNNKKILQYVTLLKVKKIYDLTELFKLVLVQKINESDRAHFYNKYLKDEKGWNIYSLIDFNEEQQLDFEERELNMIFAELDKDKSGYLNEKQLIFRLTGLQQFDKDFIINKIKDEIGGKWDLFEVFMKFDKNKDLYYDSPGDLASVLEYIQMKDIPAQHCQDLYRSGMRKGKYPYLEFLRYFVRIQVLFVKACCYFIDYFYNGDFEKFYDLGRIQNRQKWSRASMSKVNEQFLLGFTENQVGQIWQLFSQQQDALTKEQIAKIFNYACKPDENILGLQSAEKFNPFSSAQKKSIIKQKQQIKQNKGTTPRNDKEKNQLVTKLKQKKLTELALCFVKKSRQSGSMNFNQFCECLDELQIKYLKNAAMRNTSQFQEMDQKTNSMKINYINFLMYMCQTQEQDREERKAECLFLILKELMKYYGITTDDVFKKVKRPGAMRLTDYENFIRDLIKSEVYFEDIEDTWKYCGDPDYLTPEDFNKVINLIHVDDVRKQPKITRQFSFSQQEQNIRRSVGQQSAQSPYFNKNHRKKRDEVQSKEDVNIRISGGNERDRSPRISSPYDETQKGSKQQVRSYNNTQMNKSPPIRSSFGEKVEKIQKIQKPQKIQKIAKNQKHLSKQITKAEAIEKFEERVREKGSQSLNNLFLKNNSVPTQNFIDFIQENYDLTSTQCEKLSDTFSSFGKVKLQTLKKYIKKVESPKKQRNEGQSQQKSPTKDNRKQTNLAKQLQKNSKKVGQRYQREEEDENLKLQDPRKLRLNVPLVKQHIKILISSFTKRFDLNEMQYFFFQGNTTISRDQFIKKCLEINSSISKGMYQKIFAYLKPKLGLASSVAFKLVFSFDQDFEIEQTYLPEEIEQEIRAIFDKSDRDKSGYIQINEIQALLGTLGLNETQKQIQNYFSRLDQNFDKKISYREFKIFIQENILPLINDFDEQIDGLAQLLFMNDVFRTGYLPATTVGAILQRYGIRISEKDIGILNRYLATENSEISIKQLLDALSFPSQSNYSSALKAVLYKIRFKRKISFKDVQKVFQNISASFIISYTNQIIKKKILTPSAFITPVLNESRFYYNDYNYKNFYKLEGKLPNLVSIPKPNDLIVEIKLVDATGIPIPQNQSIKNLILNRSVNVIFYDTSTEEGKDCITTLQVQFDPDVEDQWIFNKNNRSIFVKISNYEPRKFEKMLLMFQFIVTVADGQRYIDVSCGTASFPVKQLSVDVKGTRKYKITAGLPNKSKQIDKMSISKRKGWRGILGSGEMDSQLQIQILPASKIQDKLPYICALPEKSIVNRKALHLMWTFRQYFAFRAADSKRINPDFSNHFIVKSFLRCLDVPDVYESLMVFWKDKIQPKVGTSTDLARRIFQPLMMDLDIVMNSRQFEILPSFPSKATYKNKNLQALRKKLLQQVFTNIQQWVNGDLTKEYQRKKVYAVEMMPFKISERQINIQTKLISQQLLKTR